MKTPYYLWLNDAQVGPYTISQLRGMWNSGSITSETMYWVEGMSDWGPLSDIIILLDPLPQPQATPLSAAATPLVEARSNKAKETRKRLIVGITLGAVSVIAAAVYAIGFANIPTKSGVYVNVNESRSWVSTVDLRSNGTAEMTTVINTNMLNEEKNLPEFADAREAAYRFIEETLTVKDGKWTIHGDVITVTGMFGDGKLSDEGEPNIRRFRVEPNGDLVQVSDVPNAMGNRYKKQ